MKMQQLEKVLPCGDRGRRSKSQQQASQSAHKKQANKTEIKVQKKASKREIRKLMRKKRQKGNSTARHSTTSRRVDSIKTKRNQL